MRHVTLNDKLLVDELARIVLAWKAARGRYLKPGPSRSWVPRWRFSPLTRITDAWDLLDRSGASYRIERAAALHELTVEVRIAGKVGRASGRSPARTITLALACALDLATFDSLTTASTGKGARGNPNGG